jgi:DNA invertase Pin-like site-specific DNA recombinase
VKKDEQPILSLPANKRTSSRIRAGMKAAKKRGAQIGRPRARFDQIRAVALFLRSKSLRKIAAELKVSKDTIRRFLCVG